MDKKHTVYLKILMKATRSMDMPSVQICLSIFINLIQPRNLHMPTKYEAASIMDVKIY